MNIKGLMLLADGFEDTEAFATYDVLVRGGLKMTTATPNHNLNVISVRNHPVKAEITFNDVFPEDYDFLVIPGGRGVSVLEQEKRTSEIINAFVASDKLVAAICAAPSIVGKLGHYKDHAFTCFPGYEAEIKAGKHVDKGVVVSGNFITGKAMYYSIDFGLAIVEALLGKEAREKTLKNLKGE